MNFGHKLRRLIAASLAVLLTAMATAGIRGPGKYSGVVIFDRWGGCILFSGVYLMYVSERVKDQLRDYEGQAIEMDALKVDQPMNPGDGLIRELKVLGPAKTPVGYTVKGIKLDARPKAIKGSRMGVELTITNQTDQPVFILTSRIGFALLSEKADSLSAPFDPSDGPSRAVITRTSVFADHHTYPFEVGDDAVTYSYLILDSTRLPENFHLAPHKSRSTQIALNLPAGHYQFFAGYGGGVHESQLVVSDPVSIDLR